MSESMSPTIAELATALAKAQAKIKHASRSSLNPFYNSRYAELAAVIDACRAALAENGLSVIQYTEGDRLYTMLLHTSGEWIRGYIDLRPMRQVSGKGWEESHDPQSYGSCITYARRYTLAAMVGVATEDDDGNAASGRTTAIAAVEAPAPSSLDDKILAAFDAAKTVDELKSIWTSIPVGARRAYAAAKDQAKARIMAEQGGQS